MESFIASGTCTLVDMNESEELNKKKHINCSRYDVGN